MFPTWWTGPGFQRAPVEGARGLPVIGSRPANARSSQCPGYRSRMDPGRFLLAVIAVPYDLP